jgi:curved DNA binding protein
MASLATEDGFDENAVQDLSNDTVMTKYKMSAEIVQKTLEGVISQCVADKSVSEICAFGNLVVEAQCKNIFKSKKVEKGLAFPTCISVNNCVCHNSPLPADSTTLKDGDVVKIDIGAHVDGFIAVVAHTHVVGRTENSEPITGPLADVLQAGNDAAKVALMTLKVGNTNAMVTEAIAKVAKTYGVNPIQGVLMHQLKRFVIDGNKVVIQRNEVDQEVDEITFEANEVYAVDIALSTGEGKPKEMDTKTTVFKRAVETNYRLKMKASRYVFNEINKKYPSLPFSIAAFDDTRQSKMGVVECVKHNMLHTYPVLFEKEGDHIVHVKFTALVLPNGTSKITSGPADIVSACKSEKKLDADSQKLVEELAALELAKAERKKNKKKKKKKKKKKAAAE